MIKINSELPISLFEEYNENLNDFDFVLFHLYKSEQEYKQYYNRLREEHPERLMILDNSAYEFYVKGEELDLDEYEKTIKELNPDFYILPDVLMDKNKTITNAQKFKKNQRNIEVYFKNTEMTAPEPFAVVQGKTIDEFNICLIYLMNMGYTNIAIPFHNRFFKEEYDECDSDIAYKFAISGYNVCTEDVRYAMGRCMWMKHHGLNIMITDGKNRVKRLHFLGSHCPAEKKYYNSLNFNEITVTMDTGYPVKCAMCGNTLGQEKEKPNIIIDDFIHDNIPSDTQVLIQRNVNIFKDY